MTSTTYPRQLLSNPNKMPSFINGLNSSKLRIVQWNIYAQGFVASDGFQYCSSSDMQIDKRLELFRNEFLEIKADIYCLQEADIHKQLCDLLNEGGEKYVDLFYPKANSPCMMYAENFGPDGCSIIYNKARLECVHECSLNLENTGSYISIFAIFRFRSNPSLKFVVACTHLKSKKHFKSVRLIQSKLLLAKFLELMSLWDITSGFVCGDFNANPDEIVIKEMERCPLHFTNVYDHLRLNREEVEEFYTSWVFKKEESQSKRHRPKDAVYSDEKLIAESELNEIIDYMWFIDSPSELLQIAPALRTTTWPLAVEDVPSKRDIGAHGIPSRDQYPSDHLSLIADYAIALGS